MFEHVIDALFRAHGYRTSTNTIVVGRSGARHEIDILASRQEDLLETRVGVECKNWSQPIDTAVVARARLVRDDLGLGQMVIACPAGATPAARTTAAEAGIAIWDRTELEQRLGTAAVSALGAAPSAGTRRGVARHTGTAAAIATVQGATRGMLGIGRGRILGSADAWLRLVEVRFGCGDRGGMRKRLRVRPLFVLYEPLGGTALWSMPARTVPDPGIDDDAPTLPGPATPQTIRTTLERTIDRQGLLIQDAARERHDLTRHELGIPVAEVVTVDEVATIDWPVHIAVVDQRTGTRAVVVDAAGGRIDETLGDCCTAHLGALARQLGIALPDASGAA
jgi:hypothetical protein